MAGSFLICAPSALFYPVCVAAGIVVLGGGGLVVGLVGGSVAGGIGGLPWETAEQVNEILVALQTTRDFPGEMQAALVEALPSERVVGPDAPDALHPQAIVTARLDEAKLRQHYSERLSLRLWASMEMRWDLDAEDPLERTCKYEYTSEKADVEDWLLDDGAAFRDAFATRTEQDETDDLPETCFQD